MDAEVVRAFLALEIPDEVRRRLGSEQEELRRQLPPARWVRPASQHLTLKFLGETPRPVLDALAAELAPRLAPLPAVDVELAGSGFFPSSRRPRVAWVGGTAAGVDPVVEAVEEVAGGHGFKRERRPWRLHLTQARLRRPWPPEAVERFLRWGREVDLPTFRRRRVVLFSSLLTPQGAVYTPLEELPLT